MVWWLRFWWVTNASDYGNQTANLLHVMQLLNLPGHKTSGLGTCRSSFTEAFLGKGVLKTCSKFTGEHPC